jgi:hypothetical protein
MNDLTQSFQSATLFLILSHPDTYRYVSRMTNIPLGSLGLASVHAVVFFIITYIIAKITGKGKAKAGQADKAGVVSNTWWFKP